MTTHRGQTALALVAAFAVSVLAACGGDDGGGDGDGATIPTEPPVAAEDPASGGHGETEQPPTAPAPVEYTGTITYAGETVELSSEDFAICETVNPAFEGDFNIITQLGDGTKFRLAGNLDDYRDNEFDGAFLGEIPEEEQVADLQLELDQRTLSGHGTGASGAIEFTFTC
jgi:hypothetical protein